MAAYSYDAVPFSVRWLFSVRQIFWRFQVFFSCFATVSGPLCLQSPLRVGTVYGERVDRLWSTNAALITFHLMGYFPAQPYTQCTYCGWGLHSPCIAGFWKVVGGTSCPIGLTSLLALVSFTDAHLPIIARLDSLRIRLDQFRSGSWGPQFHSWSLNWS